MAKSKEEAFWASMAASTLGPEWMANYSAGDAVEGHRAFDSEVHLYVVDLKTGLALGGGFGESAIESILRGMEAAGEVAAAIPNLAIKGARLMADRPIMAQGEVETKMALMNALGALASSKLVAEVRRQRGSLKGSFVYMIYSTRKGTPFVRWLFMPTSDGKLLDLLELYGVVAGTVQHDLSNRLSAVGSRITKFDGLDMCKEIATAMRATGGLV